MLRSLPIHRVLVLAALTLSVGATVAFAAATYTDPAGDVEGGAGPDLVAISVSSTAKTVAFRLRFTKAPPLRVSSSEDWVDMLLLLVDVPPKGMREVPGRGYRGVDFSIGTHGPSPTGVVSSSRARSIVTRFPVWRSGRTLGFSIARRDLGNPAWIDFVAFGARETSDEKTGGGFDQAPAKGVFRYRLRG